MLASTVEAWEYEMLTTPEVPTRWRQARARRRFSADALPPQKRGKSGGKGPSGWRRKPADEELLQFLTLHGVVSLRQAARWFYGGAMNTARYRVRLMEEAGLLTRHQDQPWASAVLVPTLDGQTIGLESAEFPVSHSTLRGHMSVPSNLLHRLLTAEHALAAQARGRRVISERQIRMLEARDETESHKLLQWMGAKYSSDGYTAGISPSTLTVTESGPDGTTVVGERNTWLGLPVYTDFDHRSAPYSQQRSGLRYPDFVEVLESGELAAVEVEVSTKSESRIRMLVDSYRDSLPKAEKYVDASGVEALRLRRGQFRHCRWIVSPEVRVLLQGSSNFLTGKHELGLLQKSMPDVYGPKFDWSNQDDRRPVRVVEAMSDDAGIQYALDQRALEPQYRSDYRSWSRWRSLWAEEVPAEKQSLYLFAWWLRSGDNHERCRQLTRR
ncbi:hypothetical protein [Rhodococcus pyridinivorans]|uniref:hypothetical protein n=1 Tax=Rhodococcus pyridinivorans TaxID=103816 RepID=UPI002285300B|nr:hypothetical protein [Rhodococcus pyridinivorans]WAL49668.1 hypothetical protein OQN32_27025 [Rhodococcus pyridinivorans]